MANQGLPGGQTTPPNINSLAAQGIQGAGMGSALGMGYKPSQVGVAGSSASVNPTNVAGSNITPSNFNVSGSNVTGQNVTGSNVTGSNVAGSNVAGMNVTPQTLAATSLNPYMNQYDNAVVQANEADILRGANMGLNTLQGQAQAANAFGGSRHGIAMGEIGRDTLSQLAQSSAGLRQAGFQNAQNAAFQDIGNNFQGQLANQGNNMQGQLANQANALQAGLANQGNALQAQGMNQGNALQAQGMNQGNALQVGLANQGNALQAQGMNQQYGMQGALANQGNALQAGLANQSAGMQAGLANQQAGMQDINNQLQASLANQSAGMQGQNQRLGAANQLAQISNLGFGMGQQVNNNLMQQGMQQQAMQQALFDAAQGQFKGFANQPVNSLGYVTAALGNTPVPETQTTTKQNGLFDYLTAATQAYGGN